MWSNTHVVLLFKKMWRLFFIKVVYFGTTELDPIIFLKQFIQKTWTHMFWVVLQYSSVRSSFASFRFLLCFHKSLPYILISKRNHNSFLQLQFWKTFQIFCRYIVSSFQSLLIRDCLEKWIQCFLKKIPWQEGTCSSFYIYSNVFFSNPAVFDII